MIRKFLEAILKTSGHRVYAAAKPPHTHQTTIFEMTSRRVLDGLPELSTDRNHKENQLPKDKNGLYKSIKIDKKKSFQ